MLTKSLCAALEWRNRGRWYFFASPSWLPIWAYSEAKALLYDPITYESVCVGLLPMQNEYDRSLRTFISAAYRIMQRQWISPSPHSPTATTLPLPCRLLSMRWSRACRYASGPPWYLVKSDELVGWHPTVAYKPAGSHLAVSYWQFERIYDSP
jgi:hypothetical protein